MYTLRIIDQTPIGAEFTRNISLGNAYEVLLKTVLRDGEKEEGKPYSKSLFDKAVEEFFCATSTDGMQIDKTIVGFVYANEASYPIRDYNVVYVVNDKGQTLERIYGAYNKY